MSLIGKPRFRLWRSAVPRLAYASVAHARNLLVVMGSGQCAPLEARRRITKRFHDGVKAVALDLPLPGSNQRFFLRGFAHERRSWVERFEIDTDPDCVIDAGAIVELERGHRRVRIDGAKFRRQLLVVAKIDLHRRYRDALLGQENANPPWARRGGAIVKFHGRSSPVVLGSQGSVRPSVYQKNGRCGSRGMPSSLRPK